MAQLRLWRWVGVRAIFNVSAWAAIHSGVMPYTVNLKNGTKLVHELCLD